MRSKRRLKFERPWFTCKVPQSHEAPFTLPPVCYRKLVGGNVERRPLPPIRRLHFDQASRATRIEGRDVETRAIALLFRYPANLLCKIGASGAFEALTLVLQNQLLTSPTQYPVSRVAFGDIIATSHIERLFEFGRRWRV
jgi:hypothetical protein